MFTLFRLSRLFILCLPCLCLLGACGPTVSYQVLEPAEVDLSGLRRLYVPGVEYPEENPATWQDLAGAILAGAMGLPAQGLGIATARAARGILLDLLAEHGYFTLLAGPEQAVDAMLQVRLEEVQCRNEDFFKERQVYNVDTRQTRTEQEPWLRRTCTLRARFTVQAIDPPRILWSDTQGRTVSDEVEKDHQYRLDDPEKVMEDLFQEIAEEVVPRLLPHHRQVRRRLCKGESPSPELSRAMALAESGSLDDARALFLHIWQKQAEPAAGCNAALLLEAAGRLDEAVTLMDEVVRKTGDPDMIENYSLLLRSRERRRRALEQLR